MRASLIIAAHNEGDALAKTIRACAGSCGSFDYELIVADDASDDGSTDGLGEQFGAKVYRNPAREGAEPAKALGASHASDDVLVFLDAHTKPVADVIPRLIADVEKAGDRTIITPALPFLTRNAGMRWVQRRARVRLDLLFGACHWLELDAMREMRVGIRTV